MHPCEDLGPAMYLIEAASGIPIYRQIIEQVVRQSASGQLRPGDVLPSVRKVAEELAINPMTVSKAYGQLEHDGVLLRRRGVGMVVAELGGKADREELLRPAAEAMIREARQLGLDLNEVVALVDRTWRSE